MPFFDRKTAALSSIFESDRQPVTLLAGGGADIGYQDGDQTPPSLSSGVVFAAASAVTLYFSEAVVGHVGFSMAGVSGVALTYSAGDGTAAIVFTTSRLLGSGEPVNVSYELGNVADTAGNILAPFNRTTVLNGSIH